jgi:cob(I)alamin adenosyltransferase
LGDKKQSSIRINKVYTKSGDKGMTQIVSGEKLSKSDARIEAYGCVDELNCHVGYCKDLLMDTKINDFIGLAEYLTIIQNELFNVGTQLAASNVENEYPQISEESIKVMEQEIDKVNNHLTELESFVLPGGSILNSQFHIARTVCRRAERRVVALAETENVNSVNIIYLNRLSDAFFVWSRWITQLTGGSENLWNPK